MSALKDEIRDGDALKFKHAIAQAARDKRIKVLEDMVQEYQNTLHETKTTYSQELEENASLRGQLRDSKHKMMLSRWASLCAGVRVQSRHNRFLAVSKDFGKSMKKEAVLHAETTTKTVRSLGETIDALRKELDDMTMARDTVKDRLESLEKQLAEGPSRISREAPWTRQAALVNSRSKSSSVTQPLKICARSSPT